MNALTILKVAPFIAILATELIGHNFKLTWKNQLSQEQLDLIKNADETTNEYGNTPINLKNDLRYSALTAYDFSRLMNNLRITLISFIVIAFQSIITSSELSQYFIPVTIAVLFLIFISQLVLKRYFERVGPNEYVVNECKSINIVGYQYRIYHPQFVIIVVNISLVSYIIYIGV